MRNKFIAGNWKMNCTRKETADLITELIKQTHLIEKTLMMVAPPYTSLATANEFLHDSKIKLGAQNLHWEDKGAYTGEISPAMLKDLECTYVVIGHSERRQYFKETDQEVNRKVKAAVKHGLLPIICVGETLDQREKGETLKVVESQIWNSLQKFPATQAALFTIAYEPVWAIGTGRAATVDDAKEVHKMIRATLSSMFGYEAAQSILIQYGGSVTADNIDAFIKEEEIDGALVGGASLKAESFAKIIHAAEAIML